MSAEELAALAVKQAGELSSTLEEWAKASANVRQEIEDSDMHLGTLARALDYFIENAWQYGVSEDER